LTDLRAHLKRIRSYPALLPLLHLDHIYFDHHLLVEKAGFHRSRRALIASDHLPLVADLLLRE
jgi:endonuclease/exonuclease/phosphatase family metal-dependent hydrolase